MKRFFNNILLLFAAVFALYACEEKMEYKDSGVKAVEKLVSPATGADLWLVNDPEATIMFEWEKSAQISSQSYAVVFYDGATGGKELFRFDSRSTKCEAVIPHDELVTMAVQAGIKPEKSGEVFWGVVSYHGNSEAVSTSRNKLNVTRYAAFDDCPVNLYLGGVADLGEENMLRAFSGNGKGVFEIFAEVSTGSDYFFTNRSDAGAAYRRFISSSGVGTGSLLESSDTAVSLEGIYHFKVDFYRGRVKIEKITDVGYFYCAGNANTAMTYEGQGVWKLSKYTIPANGDTRYRFSAKVDGVEYIWGAPKSLDSSPSSMTGSYYDVSLTPRGSINQWDYKYKFMDICKGQTADIYLNMQSSRNFHSFDFGNITPEAVTEITTPNALASSSVETPVDLADVASTNMSFNWVPGVPSDPYGIAAKYSLIFYRSATSRSVDGFVEIGRFDAGVNTSRDITGATIDVMLSDLGVLPGAVETIYWGVDTYILDKAESQATDLKAISVTRLKLPDSFYITGVATEFGDMLAGAKKMKNLGNLGSGKFQIYTKLSAGSYKFVTETNGSGNSYALEGGKLVESTQVITATAGIYRITADVLAKTLVLEQITEVKYHFAPRTTDNKPMIYIGNGKWKLTDYNVQFKSENWGADERYHFKATIAGKAKVEVWGQLNFSDGRPTGSSPLTYWHIGINDTYSDDGWWTNVFKFNGDYDGKTVDIIVDMSPEATNYTHTIDNVR